MQKNIISALALGAALWASAQDVYTPPVTLTAVSQTAETAALPYSQDFSSSTSLGQFAIFHGDADSRDWDYGSSALRFWGTPADAWAAMPKFHLEAGKVYKLSFDTNISSTGSSNYKDLRVCYGTEATVESLSTQIFFETIQSKTLTKKVVSFSVSDTGDYYVAFHCSKSSSRNDIFVDNILFEEVVGKPQPVSDLKAEVAPEGALKVALSWTNPTKDILGEDMASLDKVEVLLGTEVLATVNAPAPGTVSTAEAAVPSAGVYTFSVVPYYNGYAGSAVKVTTPWVGKDTGISSVSDVVATASPESETTVLLSFTLPTGTNGGYVDTSEIAYKITRKAGSGTTVTLEDAYSGELPYVDSTIPGLDNYTYTVYTIFNGSTSYTGKESNTIVTGGTAALPYSQDFTATNSTALFTFFRGDDAKYDWKRSTSSSEKALQYWGGPSADAWAVLPKFRLEAGKAYKLSFTTKVSRASSPKHLYVYVGTEPTAEALAEQVFYELVENQYYGKRTVTISVPATGDYCIAFRCYGPSDSNDLYVDDITLEETVVTPQPVTEAKAEAAPQGELKAVLSWVNPSHTNAGGEIAALDKVEVLSGTDVVATVDAPVAGSESSASVTVDAPGVYTYSVVPYLNGLAGEAVEVTTPWIGHDTPVAPQNVAVEDTEAGRVVTFDAVTDGVNGGYVDGSALRYTVTRNGEVLADNLDAPTYTDTETDLPLAMYTYAVSAHCNGLEGEAVSAAPMQLGAALNLPYTPDFSDKATFDLWTFSKNAGGANTWSYQSTGGIRAGSNDAWAFTPPFMALQGSAKVSWSAKAYSLRYAEDFDILLCHNNDPSDPETVTTIASVNVDNNWENPGDATFDVPEDGKYYIAYHLPKSAMYLTLTKSDIEQLTTTGVDAIGAPDGVLVNPDGTLSFGCDGTLTLYSLSGAAVWSEATQGGVVRPAVQKGIYVAAWQGVDGSTLKFKYIAK